MLIYLRIYAVLDQAVDEYADDSDNYCRVRTSNLRD